MAVVTEIAPDIDHIYTDIPETFLQFNQFLFHTGLKRFFPRCGRPP